MITALGVAELKLLLRNRTAASLAVLMPLLMGVYVAVVQGPPDDGWSVVIALQVVFTLGFGVYVTSTTALTARRQDLYLKRLRTGAASDAVVLTGILLPVVLLAVVQTVLLVGVSLVAGAPLPARPELLVLAVVGGAAVTCAAGVCTSGLTGTAELAQITTAPFFLALLVGVLPALGEDADSRFMLLPGGGLGVLVRSAWDGATGQVGLAVLSVAAWTVAGVVLATRVFRWDPRG
ncbi:ABC transporter permease [Saccharothrix syringae]|uniref:ABC transporter permease n=1 Tax=Saccharothrix syringae TaxID=103733 RepID=UPI000691C661|nr:ABC transporter permease [Saccharothrix syringae]